MCCPARVDDEYVNVRNEADIAMAVYIFWGLAFLDNPPSTSSCQQKELADLTDLDWIFPSHLGIILL
jgi:hypothetical protein